MNGQKTGNILAVAAYLVWGALPLYWALLDSVPPLVVLAFRVLCSVLLLAPILLFAKWRGEIMRVLTDRRRTLKAVTAGLLIFANWGLFIWGLEQGMHVQVSFGYYFSPLLQPGPFTIGLQTRKEQTQEALTVVRGTLEGFVRDGPTQAEVDAAKSNLVSGFPLRIDSNRKILGYLETIGFYRLPLDYLDRWTGQVEAVTREQIADAFARRLNPDAMATVVVGNGEAPAN